jgi:cobalamin synthase
MDFPSDDRKRRSIKRELRMTLVILPIITFLLGMIISFMYTNFENIFKTELTLAVFVGVIVVPTLATLPLSYSWLKRLFRDLKEI